MTAEIRRGTARFTERGVGRATHHAFSFGEVYDPDRLSFGPMVCHDEHLLGDGRGFDTHRHADLEIVSWVVSGAVRHRDSTGAEHTLVPGEVGHLHAGAGVEHSEIAAAPQTRFVQVWLRPDALGTDTGEASYAVRRAAPGPLTEALRIGGATLWAGRLAAQETVSLPEAPLVHVYLASGALLRNSLAEPMTAGDALLLRADAGATDTAGAPAVTAAVASELLVWTLPGPDQTS